MISTRFASLNPTPSKTKTTNTLHHSINHESTLNELTNHKISINNHTSIQHQTLINEVMLKIKEISRMLQEKRASSTCLAS